MSSTLLGPHDIYSLFYKGIHMDKRFNHRSNFRILATKYHLTTLKAPIKVSNCRRPQDCLLSWSPVLRDLDSSSDGLLHAGTKTALPMLYPDAMQHHLSSKRWWLRESLSHVVGQYGLYRTIASSMSLWHSSFHHLLRGDWFDLLSTSLNDDVGQHAFPMRYPSSTRLVNGAS